MSRIYFRSVGNETEEMVQITSFEAVNVKAALALGLISRDELLNIRRQDERKEAA
jgi:hypothetical protein